MDLELLKPERYALGTWVTIPPGYYVPEKLVHTDFVDLLHGLSTYWT